MEGGPAHVQDGVLEVLGGEMPLPPMELPYTLFLTIRVVGSSVTLPPTAMESSNTW